LAEDAERLAERDRRISAAELDMSTRETGLIERESVLAEAEEQRRRELERIAALTADAARQELVESIEAQAKREAAILVRDIENDARSTAEQRARHVVVDAIQRVASEQTAESVVSVLHLPSDEMKGRIIGREGRNIRAFESVTGVNLIIDDTPEACCCPASTRCAARSAGSPWRSWSSTGGSTRTASRSLRHGQARGRAAVRAGRRGRAGRGRHHRPAPGAGHAGRPAALPHQLRAERAQAPLETAHIAGIMAAELGLDRALIKRCAFLHDIGKALTHEVEGSHALIGADVARKYGEREVVHAIEAHHNEVLPQTIEAVLTQASDAVLGWAPGGASRVARGVREAAGAHRGDRRHQGRGREGVRDAGRTRDPGHGPPDDVDDIGAAVLARDVAKQIEEELTYPGQIRVTVVRESRVTEIAR
jgi:ribonuclease Y